MMTFWGENTHNWLQPATAFNESKEILFQSSYESSVSQMNVRTEKQGRLSPPIHLIKFHNGIQFV